MISRCAFIPLIALALALTGCQKDTNNQETAYQVQQLTKPLVALVPVIDNTKNDVFEWNLSDEFTSSIFSCLSQGPLYLENASRVREMVNKCKEMQNPFGTNIAWIKKAFEKEQFVVFLELIEHEEILKREYKEIDPKMCSADLNLSMRIRVFDLRGS